MKALATLLLLFQLGPFAGPLLCHAQASCDMPRHAAGVVAPVGSDADMSHGNCSGAPVCNLAAPAVVSSAVQLAPVLQQDHFVLAGVRPLLAGIRAAPLPPPPRA
jgi:hypothetical protein